MPDCPDAMLAVAQLVGDVSAGRLRAASRRQDSALGTFVASRRVRVCIVGGRYFPAAYYGRRDPASAAVDFFDPQAQTWCSNCSMTAPREGTAAAARAGLLFVVGGACSGSVIADDKAECFCPFAGSWRKAPRMGSGSAWSAAVALRRSIYIIGGLGNPSEANTVTSSFGGSTILSSVERLDTETWS